MWEATGEKMQVAEFNKSGFKKKKTSSKSYTKWKAMGLNVSTVVAIIHNVRLAEKKGGFANKSNH